MADSIIVGQFVGSSALAAVGACAALTNVFICIALGAGVGAGVLVSRYFGARDYSKMKTIVSTSLISFLILSILLGVFGFCFSHSMMRLLQTPADILEAAVLYLRVYFVGFPFFVYVQYPFNDVHIDRRVKNSTGSFDIFFCFEYIYGSLDGGRTWPGYCSVQPLQLSLHRGFRSVFTFDFL